MPLTSITSCYKTLPSYFADKVTEHAKKRRETSSTRRSETSGSSDHNDEMVPWHPSSMTKRSLTPLATISDNESDDGTLSRHQNVAVADPGPLSSEEPVGNRTPRGSKRQSPSPRHQSSTASSLSSWAASWQVIPPRRLQTSPRTAISLDNVDLWEEEDEASDADEELEGFDKINGIRINPRLTIDLSELRRSRSPVATKRNKMDAEVEAIINTEERAERTLGPSDTGQWVKPPPSPSPRRPGSRTQKWLTSNLANVNKNRSAAAVHSGLVRPRARRPEISKHGNASNETVQTRIIANTRSRETLMTNAPSGDRLRPKSHVNSRDLKTNGKPKVKEINRTERNAISSKHSSTSKQYLSAQDFTCIPSSQQEAAASSKLAVTSEKIPTDLSRFPDPATTNSSSNSNSNSGTNASIKMAKVLELRRANTRLICISANKQSDAEDNRLGEYQGKTKSALGSTFVISSPSPGTTSLVHESPDINQRPLCDRKVVKFNNFVQVHDGDVATVDQLRESNNSAQLLKQKYLGTAFRRLTKTLA